MTEQMSSGVELIFAGMGINIVPALMPLETCTPESRNAGSCWKFPLERGNYSLWGSHSSFVVCTIAAWTWPLTILIFVSFGG